MNVVDGSNESTRNDAAVDADASGAWNAAEEGIASLEQCVARARPCKMANYVSFSNVPGNSDCS